MSILRIVSSPIGPIGRHFVCLLSVAFGDQFSRGVRKVSVRKSLINLYVVGVSTKCPFFLDTLRFRLGAFSTIPTVAWDVQNPEHVCHQFFSVLREVFPVFLFTCLFVHCFSFSVLQFTVCYSFVLFFFTNISLIEVVPGPPLSFATLCIYLHLVFFLRSVFHEMFLCSNALGLF